MHLKYKKTPKATHNDSTNKKGTNHDKAQQDKKHRNHKNDVNMKTREPAQSPQQT